MIEQTPWCEKGHEVAWAQFLMPVGILPVPRVESINPSALDVIDCEGMVHIKSAGVEVLVDVKAANIQGVKYQGQTVLDGFSTLSVWRATTDNDGIRGWTGQEKKPMGLWLSAGLNALTEKSRTLSIDHIDDEVEIYSRRVYVGSDASLECVHEQMVRVCANGDLIVNNVMDYDARLPSLPRVGVAFKAAAGFESLKWLGRGPWENHIDRNVGAPVGLYEGTVDGQYVDYVLPQENGNKSDVSWFSLSNEKVSLRFIADPKFEFSVRHFTDDDLFSSYHTNELERKRRAETIIHLDHIQRGVGTGSCGPHTFDHYCVNPGRYEFSYRIQLSAVVGV
jgi:beta-galactosidase